METEKFLIDFRIHDEIEIPDDIKENTEQRTNEIIKSVLGYCELNNIDEIGYSPDHGHEFDNHDDYWDEDESDSKTIPATETYVTIRFEVPKNTVPSDEKLNWLYAAALKQLRNADTHIANYYSRGQGVHTITSIEFFTYGRE